MVIIEIQERAKQVVHVVSSFVNLVTLNSISCFFSNMNRQYQAVVPQPLPSLMIYNAASKGDKSEAAVLASLWLALL